MIGAIIGDVIGSKYEFHNHRSKQFLLFEAGCFATDDSIMTLAIAKAVLESKLDWSDLGANASRCMREVGQHYPDCGYGGRFQEWVYSANLRPYNSYGNGAAMRVSPVAYAASSVEEVKRMSRLVTEVTHNHLEGIKGAEATAVAVWMALHGATMAEIREVMERDYYRLDFTLDEIRPTYRFNETCQETVPQALEAFFEATDFEDALRNAISIGGDSDTLAAITCSVAGAYFGVPKGFAVVAEKYLDRRLKRILHDFREKYM